MSDKISADVVALSDAYGIHIRALGKYWGLAASVAIVAFTADTTTSIVEIFGFKLKAIYFYPACAAFGAILNFAYCISHLQAYRAGEVFRGYLSSIDASSTDFTSKSKLLDAAHLLYPSAINRVYPVYHFLPTIVSERFVKFLKLPVDLFVFLVPISGCFYAVTKIEDSWWSLPIWSLVVISSLMSALLTISGVRWIFSVTNDATG